MRNGDRRHRDSQRVSVVLGGSAVRVGPNYRVRSGSLRRFFPRDVVAVLAFHARQGDLGTNVGFRHDAPFLVVQWCSEAGLEPATAIMSLALLCQARATPPREG